MEPEKLSRTTMIRHPDKMPAKIACFCLHEINGLQRSFGQILSVKLDSRLSCGHHITVAKRPGNVYSHGKMSGDRTIHFGLSITDAALDVSESEICLAWSGMSEENQCLAASWK
jgi:hypothetical protein